MKAGHATTPGPLVEAFLQAARELAPGSIARTLDAARETLGLDRTVDEVLLPSMREIGEWWHAGQIDVSHEHLATNATQAWLAALRPTGPAPDAVTDRPQLRTARPPHPRPGGDRRAPPPAPLGLPHVGRAYAG